MGETMGSVNFRQFAIALAVVMAGYVSAREAHAQAAAAFPGKPVRFISAAVAGAGSDTTARAIAHRLTQMWGHQVIVDNRPGASGLIALDVLVKAIPDGHTLALISANVPLNTAINPTWPYDVQKDMKPLSQVTSLFYIAYHHPAVALSTFKDLLAYGRAQPGKLYFSSAGTGSLQHLGWEIVMQMSGARYTHVPYKSGAPAITATISGETQFGFGTLISLRPHMTSGRLRAIAVTSKQRAPTLPDVPTIAESGLPGYEVDQWYGAATSARVPVAVINKLNADIVAAVKSPDVAQRLAADGSTAVGSSVEQFSAKIRDETAMWRKIAKETGLVLK